MFELTSEETESLRCQIGISKTQGRGGTRYFPLVFTEQGVAMLSSVLHSTQAVLVNIEIMRAFVRVRQVMEGNRDLAKKLSETLGPGFEPEHSAPYIFPRRMSSSRKHSALRRVG